MQITRAQKRSLRLLVSYKPLGLCFCARELYKTTFCSYAAPETAMGNTFGSKPTETKKRPHNNTCDDQESLSGEDDHPRTLSAEGRRIASGGDMSAEQLTAAGNYLWELMHSNDPERDYSSNRVLTHREVFAVKPPRSLTYTEPQLDTLSVLSQLMESDIMQAWQV